MTTVKSPRIPVRLTILPLVLALGACAFAPDRKPPAAPQPAQYGVQPLPAAGITAQGVAQHYEQGAQPVPQWWKRYGSPELDALVEEGLAKTGPGRHRPLAGRGPRAAARPDQLVPDAQRGRRRRGLAQARADHARPARSHQALQHLHRPDPGALRGGHLRRRALRQQAESARVEQRAFQLDSARRALAANIVTGAIRSAALAERVALTEKQAVLSRQVARDAQRRYELGSASQSEALDADRDAANLEASLPGLYAEWQSIRHALAVLLGRTPDQAPPGLRRADAARSGAGAGAVGSAGLAPGHPRGGNGGACSRR